MMMKSKVKKIADFLEEIRKISNYNYYILLLYVVL